MVPESYLAGNMPTYWGRRQNARLKKRLIQAYTSNGVVSPKGLGIRLNEEEDMMNFVHSVKASIGAMGRNCLLVAVIFAVFPFAVVVGAEFPTMGKNEFVMTFDDLFLHAKLDGKEVYRSLIKRKYPIRVGVAGSLKKQFIPIIEGHVSTIGKIIGLNTDVTFEKSNFIIILSNDVVEDFSNRYRMMFRTGFYSEEQFLEYKKSINNNEKYFQITKTDHDGRIDISISIINVDILSDDEIESIVLRILVNGVSQPVPRKYMEGSVFDSNSFASRLSGDDKRLLGTLYDPRLKIGMKRKEVLKVLDEIVEEWL
jgi:hypothetical protein